MVLGRFRVKGKKGCIAREGVETSTPEVCVIKSKTIVTAVEEAFNKKGDSRLRLRYALASARTRHDLRSRQRLHVQRSSRTLPEVNHAVLWGTPGEANQQLNFNNDRSHPECAELTLQSTS